MNAEENKIVCVGSLNVDVTLFVSKFCKEDEEGAINELSVSSGGAAANIASGLGRLGNNVYFFGNIGQDEHTQLLLKDFEKDNVNYSIAKRTQKPNNSCFSIVDETSQRIMYAYNHVEFTAIDFPEQFYSKELDFLIFTSLASKKIINEYEKIARKAKVQGTKIVFSPGNIFIDYGFEKLKELISLSDYLILSETEIALLDEELKTLLEICSNIIITKGKNGVELYKKGREKIEFEAFKVQNPIDATGAGDCFLAALISNLSKGKKISEAITFSTKAAALSVTKKGARSMPTLQEIEND